MVFGRTRVLTKCGVIVNQTREYIVMHLFFAGFDPSTPLHKKTF